MPVLHSIPLSCYTSSPSAGPSSSCDSSYSSSRCRDDGKTTATNLLENYISDFEHSAPRRQNDATALQSTATAKSAAEDAAYQLLQQQATISPSCRTRQILRDLDRSLGYSQPFYSTPQSLNLSTRWPDLHEYLERRWKRRMGCQAQQRQREQLEKQGNTSNSSNDLYQHHHKPSLLSISYYAPRCREMPKLPSSHSLVEFEQLEAECEKQATVLDDKQQQQQQKQQQQQQRQQQLIDNKDQATTPMDGGNEVNDLEVKDEELPTRTEVEVQSPLAVEWRCCAKPDGDDDAKFQQKLDGYRRVLEGRQVACDLRQQLLGAAAAAAAGGHRPLQIEHKAQIRENLHNLQYCATAVAEKQADSRITTERLSQLMTRAARLADNRPAD